MKTTVIVLLIASYLLNWKLYLWVNICRQDISVIRRSWINFLMEYIYTKQCQKRLQLQNYFLISYYRKKWEKVKTFKIHWILLLPFTQKMPFSVLLFLLLVFQGKFIFVDSFNWRIDFTYLKFNVIYFSDFKMIIFPVSM